MGDESSARVYAGIDVSKGRLDVCVVPSGKTLGVDNDQAGIGQVVGLLLPLKVTLTASRVAGR